MDTSRDEILRKLAVRTGNGVRDLNVRIDAEHVLITGRAPSYYVKQIATQTAIAAVGSIRVRNEIEVDLHEAAADTEAP